VTVRNEPKRRECQLKDTSTVIFHSLTLPLYVQTPTILDDHCNANTSAPQVEAAKNKYNYQLIGCIILGDFCHNFCDGIFVGNAFLFCERQVAYAIVAATLYHELAQEFADYTSLRPSSRPGAGSQLCVGLVGHVGRLCHLDVGFFEPSHGGDSGCLRRSIHLHCCIRVPSTSFGTRRKQNCQESHDFYALFCSGSGAHWIGPHQS